MRIALTGNPNSGKTTMYNALTGSNEKVGNWAGVTVDKKEHPIKRAYFKGKERLVAVDLERRVVNEVHDVGTGLEKRLRERFDARAHKDRANLDAKLAREFARLAEKFKRNVGELALLLLRKDPNFALCVFHELKG